MTLSALDVYRLRDSLDQEIARQVGPYGDEALVGEMTARLMEGGHRLFQIFKLADTDERHVATLLRYFNAPADAHVLDLGCGVGEVARLMSDQRSDLRFTLVNASLAQLERCPERFRESALIGELDDIPLADQSVDAVMICYALGHAELDKTMEEVERVLRPGGVLFIYDIAAAEQSRILAALGYKAHPEWAVYACAESHGMERSYDIRTGMGNIEDFRRLCPGDDVMRAIADARPALYRFVKDAA